MNKLLKNGLKSYIQRLRPDIYCIKILSYWLGKRQNFVQSYINTKMNLVHNPEIVLFAVIAPTLVDPGGLAQSEGYQFSLVSYHLAPTSDQRSERLPGLTWWVWRGGRISPLIRPKFFNQSSCIKLHVTYLFMVQFFS